MKKTKAHKWQVKYSVRAIVSIEVVANTEQEARDKAAAIQNKSLFKAGIECIDTSEKFAGIDDLKEWDLIN